MTKLLAIDWDAHELRVANATSKGRRLQVQCRAIARNQFTEADESTDDDLAELLRGQIKDASASHVLLTVPRSAVETRVFTFPPATDDELPLLVEAQSSEQLAYLGDDVQVDFTSLDDDPTQDRRVAAVACSATTTAEFQSLLGGGRQHCGVLTPRAYGLAELYCRTGDERNEPAMLVNLFPAEIEIVLVAQDRVWLWRAIQRHTDGDDAEQLLGELSRTLAVAATYLPVEREVERVVLFGDDQSTADLTQRIGQALDVEVQNVDPQSIDDIEVVPSDVGASRFAPLLGMLAAEANGGKLPINLLAPKRHEAQQRSRRPLLIAAGIVLLIGLGYIWADDQVQQSQSQLTSLRTQLAKLESANKKYLDKGRLGQQLSAWQAGDINWLDELRDLSARFPDNEQIVATSFIAGAGRGNAAIIRLNGRVRDPSTVALLDQQLRDEFRDVLSRNFRQVDQQQADYAWRFESLISTPGRPKAEYNSAPHANPSSKRVEIGGAP